MSYFRATDPFPLESADHTKLHTFYARLAEGRLVTTRCSTCGATAWPPRGFCGECASDAFEWVDLAREGTIHAFTVQDTGLPAGFDGPRVFAYYYLWWSTNHWHDKLGSSYPYTASPLPLPATQRPQSQSQKSLNRSPRQ